MLALAVNVSEADLDRMKVLAVLGLLVVVLGVCETVISGGQRIWLQLTALGPALGPACGCAPNLSCMSAQ